MKVAGTLALWASFSASLHTAQSQTSFQEPLDLQSEATHEPRSELLELHRKLVEIESISGNEYEVGGWLSSYLESHNFTVEKQEVAPKRFNILAYPGKERKTKVLVTSHIDTVPPFIPYTHWHSNHTLYGRGSVDAKACVAAQTIAAINVLSSSSYSLPPNALSLLFVVGEETGGDGMRYFSSHKPTNYTAVIFGEPTEAKLVAGHKGILEFKLNIEGKAAHSGYPWLGISANNLMIEALGKLLALEAKLPKSEKYGNSTLNIGRVTGGVAANVVAEKAEAEIGIRLAAGEPADTKKLVLEALQPVIEEAARIGGSMNLEFTQEGYPPVDCDHNVDGFDVITVNYGTDVPNLAGDHKRYLYGPGSILVAHGANEGLKAKELEGAVGDFEKLILAALGKK